MPSRKKVCLPASALRICQLYFRRKADQAFEATEVPVSRLSDWWESCARLCHLIILRIRRDHPRSRSAALWAGPLDDNVDLWNPSVLAAGLVIDTFAHGHRNYGVETRILTALCCVSRSFHRASAAIRNGHEAGRREYWERTGKGLGALYVRIADAHESLFKRLGVWDTGTGDVANVVEVLRWPSPEAAQRRALEQAAFNWLCFTEDLVRANVGKASARNLCRACLEGCGEGERKEALQNQCSALKCVRWWFAAE